MNAPDPQVLKACGFFPLCRFCPPYGLPRDNKQGQLGKKRKERAEHCRIHERYIRIKGMKTFGNSAFLLL